MSTTLEDFDLAVRTVVAKGKLSPTLVENVVKLAMLNITADAHLVSTLFRANKKATAQNKISALYLLDAVCRDARARLKKQGKQKEKKSDQEQDPVEGVDSQGTYSSFLTKVEQILPKFMLDCWENGPIEHRDKVRKVLDIWTKAGTFGAPTLLRVSNKLVATSTPSAAPSRPPSVPATSSAASLEPPVASGSTIPANVLALLARQAAAGASPVVASGSGYGSPNPPPTIPALPPLDFALLQQLANATANASSQNSPMQQRPGGAPPQQQQQQDQSNNRDVDQRRGSEQEWNRDGNNGGNYRGNGQGNGGGNGGGGNWGGNNDRGGPPSSSGGNWGGQQQQQNNNSFSNNNNNNSWNGPPQNRPPPPQQQQGGPMNNGARGSWDQSSRPGGDKNRGGNNFGNRDGPGRAGDFNQSQQGGLFNSGTIRRDPPESMNEPPAKRSFPPQNFPGNPYPSNNSYSTPVPPPHSPPTSNGGPPVAGKAQIHPSRLQLQAVRPDLDEFGREKRADAEPDSPPRIYTRPTPISPALGSASSSSTFPPPSPAQPILPPPIPAAQIPTDDRQLVAQQLQQRIQMQNQAKAAIQAQAQAQMQAQRDRPQSTPQAPPQQYQQQQQPPAPMMNRQPIQQQAPPPPVVIPTPVVPFDMSSFDATNPSSWTGFAAMYKAQYGFSPTNEQIMGMVMSSMQQSMYAQQGGGGTGASGYGGGAGAGMGNDLGGGNQG